MFVPGVERASAAGLSGEGADRLVPGVGVGAGAAPAVTVSVADCEESSMAVIVTGVLEETDDVVTVNLAEVWPTGTATVPGTAATKRLLVESVTLIPPEGAGALRKTVPLAFVPPATVAGVRVID